MAGKSSKGAMRGLDQKGHTWWMKVAIPVDCRAHFNGKQTYLESLQTADVRIAKERRDQADRDVRDLFAQIRAGKGNNPAKMSVRERGELWRQTLIGLEATPQDDDPEDIDEDDESYTEEVSLEDIARDLAYEESRRLPRQQRREFTNALAGKVSVDAHLEAYLKALATKKLAPGTIKERRGLVGRLTRWCDQEGLRLSDIDRRAAGRYVTATIEPMDRSTAKKHMTAIRGYWDYLTMRGHVEGKVMNGKAVDSPWLGQTMPENKRRAERGDRDNDERHFTEAEVRTLLYSDYPEGMDRAYEQQLTDALGISLLSGMRMAEVLTLWVEEVHDGVFDIRQGKTASAARKVPIHPDLRDIVERRTIGKGPKQWLFHELALERDPGDTFGKRFNRYRKHLKVDDVRPGKRRSLVNFHSARRWFVVQARHLGQTKETIKDVVGHAPDKKDITFGVYTHGASDEQMKACVEAVRLPEPVRTGPQG